MLFKLSIRQDDEGELASLYRWLSDDPEITEAVDELSLGTAAERPDAMTGWSADLILATVETGFAGLTAVIAAIALWQKGRVSPSTVRMERDAHGSVVVEVSSPDIEEARRLAADLMHEQANSPAQDGDAAPEAR